MEGVIIPNVRETVVSLIETSPCHEGETRIVDRPRVRAHRHRLREHLPPDPLPALRVLTVAVGILLAGPCPWADLAGLGLLGATVRWQLITGPEPLPEGKVETADWSAEGAIEADDSGFVLRGHPSNSVRGQRDFDGITASAGCRGGSEPRARFLEAIPFIP